MKLRTLPDAETILEEYENKIKAERHPAPAFKGNLNPLLSIMRSSWPQTAESSVSSFSSQDLVPKILISWKTDTKNFMKKMYWGMSSKIH